jgi:glutaredoxin-related protein
VTLSPEQRPAIEALVSERETLMTSACSDAVLERQDCASGAEEVRRIYLDFDNQIRRSLTPDQQALYDTARVEGRIGAPMFVFRYGQ